MRADNNATAVYLGTVRSRYDALWRKKEELQALQAADNIQRVYWAGPDLVTAANPQYDHFLQAQVTCYGRMTLSGQWRGGVGAQLPPAWAAFGWP